MSLRFPLDSRCFELSCFGSTHPSNPETSLHILRDFRISSLEVMSTIWRSRHSNGLHPTVDNRIIACLQLSATCRRRRRRRKNCWIVRHIIFYQNLWEWFDFWHQISRNDLEFDQPPWTFSECSRFEPQKKPTDLKSNFESRSNSTVRLNKEKVATFSNNLTNFWF